MSDFVHWLIPNNFFLGVIVGVAATALMFFVWVPFIIWRDTGEWPRLRRKGPSS